MNFFMDLIVGGLAIGACYALIALAMVIIYKTSCLLYTSDAADE